MNRNKTEFQWDDNKNEENIRKHAVSFEQAQFAFADPLRIIYEDEKHSCEEDRFYLIGFDGVGIVTVRFTMRDKVIRIFGAGYWRKGKKLYERSLSDD